MFEGNRKRVRSSENRRLLPWGDDAEAFVEPLNYMSLGVILTGFEGKALFPTRSARDVLSSPGCLIVCQRRLMAGDPEAQRQPENCRGSVNPVDPRACCDDGEQCAETLFFDCTHQYGVDIHVARKFNTCGPRMCPNDSRVVSTFVVQVLKGKPVTLHGHGSQTRSFRFIYDLVTGLVIFMQTPDEPTGPANLGSSTEVSIKQLPEIITDMIGSKSQVVFRPLPADDPLKRRSGITMARKYQVWESSVMLKEGQAKTIEYLNRMLSERWILQVPLFHNDGDTAETYPFAAALRTAQ